MIRETSIEAYNTIRENGLLSMKRWDAYDAVVNSDGRQTHNELEKWIREIKPLPKGVIYRNNIVARLGELRDMGVIQENGTKRCSISSMTCITWIETGELPKKPKKEKSYKEKYEDLMLEIQNGKKLYSHIENNAVWSKTYNRLNHEYEGILIKVSKITKLDEIPF